MTEIPWDGTRRIIWPKPLDEMEVIGNRFFTVAVPADADPEFKAYILAAGTTHSMGNKSIDNVLRRHSSKWIEDFASQAAPNAPKRLDVRLRRAAISRIEELLSIKPSDCCVGENASVNVLIRLASTFRGAIQLVRLGFAFEAEAVVRLGLEQIAWAYSASELTDSVALTKLSSTHSISQLRHVFPGVGRIYGRLSNLAHIDPVTHERFVNVTDGGTEIVIESLDAVRETLLFLTILLDGLLVVSELLFSRFGIPQVSIDSATRQPLPTRLAASLLSDFKSHLGPDAVEIFDKWWRSA